MIAGYKKCKNYLILAGIRLTQWFSHTVISCLAFRKNKPGNSLAVQWLGLGAFTAVGPGSIPGRGTKIPQAMR